MSIYAEFVSFARRATMSITLMCLISCSKPPGQRSDNLFVWDRPSVTPNNLPITQSATCRFKNGLAASFDAELSNKEPNPPRRIYYSQSDEDEANTVSFVDLDTKTPKVQSNGGQGALVVVSDVGGQLTLLNLARAGDGAELYTIFRNTGIVIYSQQKNSAFLGPFGVLEMGYCN
jgi:hypothetical protein